MVEEEEGVLGAGREKSAAMQQAMKGLPLSGGALTIGITKYHAVHRNGCIAKREERNGDKKGKQRKTKAHDGGESRVQEGGPDVLSQRLRSGTPRHALERATRCRDHTASARSKKNITASDNHIAQTESCSSLKPKLAMYSSPFFACALQNVVP